jgi:uncharacterized Fe-S cluster-containing radical SAM superfamily protein
MDTYPSYITPDFEPFDPLELAKKTEEIVCQGIRRRYTDFYATGVYGGIATGYTCGCCLRCVFCWVGWSRDFPDRFGSFYSPQEAFCHLKDVAHKNKLKKLRISGAEPTLGKTHLLTLLELVEQSDFDLFILETNGILLGQDKDYVEKISQFRKVHVRVSIKAGNPQSFTKKTGSQASGFDLPFRAIQNLKEFGASFHVAAMSADPRIVSVEERKSLIERLKSIDPQLLLSLEEEVVDPYDTTLKRLEASGFKLDWPLKEIYPPIRRLF